MNLISKKIKVLRCDKNMTQQQVADKLNMSQNAYSKMELGYTDIGYSRMRQLAGIFCVPVSYLVIEQYPDQSHKPESLMCLTQLVLLKNYKEINGKDDYYQREQRKVWEQAKRIVNV